MEYVSQPGIVPDRIESRRYQVNIARACLRENTLVILPTGLGKTAVALMVAEFIIYALQAVHIDDHRADCMFSIDSTDRLS